MYGHVGDGNIHTRPLLDPKDPADLRTMQRLYDEVSAYVREHPGHHVGRARRRPAPHPLPPRDVRGRDLLPLHAGQECVRSPGRDEPRQEGRAAGEPGRAATPGFAAIVPRYGFDYRTLPQKPILHFPAAEYESEIEKCHGCAQCKSTVVTTMCPIYKATRREHASPRAKANLLRAIITGALDPDSTYGEAAMKSVTDYCIECGMCAVECPSNVNIPKLMLEAKSKYRAAHRGSPVDDPRPRRDRVAPGPPRRAAGQPAVTQPLCAAWRSRWPASTGGGRMPRFARQTFAQTRARRRAATRRPATPARSTARRPAAGRLLLRPLRQLQRPGAGADGRAACSHAHGVEVVLPEQRASGIPEMLYGYADAARETAEFNVGGVLPWMKRGAAVLVSAEPTATFAFKVHYPDYLASPDCSLVANATHDLGEFLVRYRADHPETGRPPPARSPAPGRASGASPITSPAT